MTARKKSGANPVASGGTLLPLTLALLVIASAIAVVQVKHRNRSVTTRLEAARQEHQALQLEWAQLQLEEATMAQHGRVDSIARSQFGMVDPAGYQIVDAAPATPAAASKPAAADSSSTAAPPTNRPVKNP